MVEVTEQVVWYIPYRRPTRCRLRYERTRERGMSVTRLLSVEPLETPEGEELRDEKRRARRT